MRFQFVSNFTMQHHSFFFPGFNPGNGGNSRGLFQIHSHSRGCYSRGSARRATKFLRSIDSIPTIPGVRQGLNSVPGVAIPRVPEGTEETMEEFHILEGYKSENDRQQAVMFTLNPPNWKIVIFCPTLCILSALIAGRQA